MMIFKKDIADAVGPLQLSAGQMQDPKQPYTQCETFLQMKKQKLS